MRTRKNGFILVVVLVIIILASMVALSLMFRLQAEQFSFAASAGSEQAWYAAMSGIQQTMHLASSPDRTQWQDNPGALRQQLVYDDGSDKWYFTVYCAAPPEEQQARAGIVNENGKINLNTATAEMIRKCAVLPPSVVDEIAHSSSSATNSAESGEGQFFDAISRPRFSTMDDLLKLPGMLPGMVYGEDANHNYHLDPNEDDGVLQFPPDDSDGQLFLGLQRVATVYSYELNLASDGSARIQLNGTNQPGGLEGVLPEKTLQYIQLARQNHKVFKSPAELLEAKDKFKDAQGKEVEVESGVTAKELPVVLDKLTASFDKKRIGLININTADVKVLQVLPDVSQAKAEAILAAREGLSTEQSQSIAWLYQEGLFDAAGFKKLAPLITARSLQFRFNVLGYALPSGRYRVYEVVIDTAGKEPHILYLRDISRFGLPFALPTGEESSDVVQNKT
jgi:DNA uptake protein ComE-like DNA-binding protein